jgi:hypothetical protein
MAIMSGENKVEKYGRPTSAILNSVVMEGHPYKGDIEVKS